MKEVAGTLGPAQIPLATPCRSRDHAQPSGWGELVSWSRGKSVELNRRSVRNQITDIERQLKAVEKNRETLHEKRLESPVFKIGLIGYTNAGKSTIMNQLTSKSQYEADELFATLDATTKSIHLTGNLQVTPDRYGWFYSGLYNRVGIEF